MGRIEPIIARKQTSSGKKTKRTKSSSKKPKVNPRYGMIEPIIHRKPKPKKKTTTSKKTTKTKTQKKTTTRSTAKKSRTAPPKRRTTTRKRN